MKDVVISARHCGQVKSEALSLPFGITGDMWESSVQGLEGSEGRLQGALD